MAHTIYTRLTNETDSTWMTHTFIRSDGATGELTDQSIISVAELTPVLPAGMYLSIYELWYTVSNFTIQLGWKTSGATYPTLALANGVDSYMDFKPLGGVIDMSGATSSGKLVMATTGFTTTASFAHLIIRGRKHSGNTPNYATVGLV